MTDALVALYKLNPWLVLRSIYPGLVEANSPNKFKLCFIRACNQIVSEEAPMAWWPKMDASFAVMLRVYFIEYSGRVKLSGSMIVSPEVKSPSKPKKLGFLGGRSEDKVKKEITEDVADRHECTRGILKTWAMCPLLVIAVWFGGSNLGVEGFIGN
jgi:hypothetical protein